MFCCAACFLIGYLHVGLVLQVVQEVLAMDALFPPLEDMQALTDLIGYALAYGMGFGASLWALGLVFSFVPSITREV